jgi:DnaJ-class molecular chaperone
MTVVIECGACAGSGQWPNADGSTIRPCPHCDGAGAHAVEVSGKLEQQLQRLRLQQEQERQAALLRHEQEQRQPPAA